MSKPSNSFVSEPSTAEPATSELNIPTSLPCTCVICMNSFALSKVIEKSQDVFINREKLNEIARLLSLIIIENLERDIFRDKFIKHFFRHKSPSYPTVCDNKTLDWLFVLSALNFSLWYPSSSKQWTVSGQKGYMALCYAIKRAIDEGRPIWCSTYYSKITLKELKIIFRSDDNETIIPLIDERVRVLHEIGAVLLNKFQGTFRNCIKFCKGNGIKLLHLLLKEFESFRDKTYYEGKEVFIGSKMIVLINDLTYFKKIDGKTFVSAMFHDYRTPQIFFWLSILSYSDRLITKFANEEPLEHGSREAVEIRCNTLYACYLLLDKMIRIYDFFRRKMPTLAMINLPITMDNILWFIRYIYEDILNNSIPYHNIRSIYY